MAMTRVPNAGGDAVPGGYPAPTPHAAKAAQDVYEAPSSLPSSSAGTATTAAFDAIEGGLGEADML